MPDAPEIPAAGGDASRRLFVFNAGFVTQRRVRRILQLAGWQPRLGWPGAGDRVAVWGHSPTAHRGERVAARTGAALVRVEDAFLRSLRPGRTGAPPMGLLIDRAGVHFDSSHPSDLERLLATHRLDDTALLDRARAAMARMRLSHLSKYNAFDPALAHPLPDGQPYVLVIDQTRGDASIRLAGARAATFREMLVFAQVENPGHKVLIKTHPETAAGLRPGHYGPEDATGQVRLVTGPHSPWRLLEGASAVYTVSSGMGFEAILAGHAPRVFGQPFYAGWGLTQDENPVARRTRRLTRAQLFAGAMILYPTWYDPYRDQLCQIECVLDNLEAQARAWREDRAGYVAAGMRLWKRAPLSRFFGREKRMQFDRDPARAAGRAAATGRQLMLWGSAKAPPAAAVLRIEDGFLRSRGLGAELTPPLSLVRDDLGIYYDPSRESRLERLIAASPGLPDHAIRRAEALIARLTAAGLSKYNLPDRARPDLPDAGKRTRILVPGQVEDDASIRLGCDAIRTNGALLERARAAHPEAQIIYKPHPDVEAGLRPGKITNPTKFADIIAENADPIALIEHVDAIWTLTSLLGFEALLRGRDVTCLGTPFYAGWGLTTDLGTVPARRSARPSLAQLVHATLIDYPRYHDPETGLPCPVEVVVDRLQSGHPPRRGPANRALSKLQGLFASAAPFWR
ncbi:MAG TPA: capsular polysaccharide biosynthesis protein [Aliiroseovarius sp.]|nr:capsular polysaccharide biosynthesis protein [Aliiroseovarius sp.]